ncbi:hypothetical protein [Deinococcus aquiradiocola]|uniref:Uncharacterized protein n=1 Tax=Deinococcus aquiradiocola TaxID=393059 RepID=A0A917UIB5_9DEIO|nr:hypothetical protein [Deinococcus aquiradiocola]GGJ60537.1 hypothetical protein GCM10008939_00340 [Deinococcus aquiradiocola]
MLSIPLDRSSRAGRPASALPRPLDFTYPSNRTALFGSVAFGALTLALTRDLRRSAGVGGQSLFGWMTARELDPDAPQSASVALVAAGAVALSAALGRPGRDGPGRAAPVLPGLAAMSALRVLTGTVGHAPSRQDAAALAVQAGLAALTGQRAAALVPGAALALAAREPDALRCEVPWASPAAFGAALLPARRTGGAAEVHEGTPSGRGQTVLADLLALSALGTGRWMSAPETPSSRCDEMPLLVSGPRLRASRLLALGTLAAGVLRGESLGLAPLAAAALGVGTRRAWPDAQAFLKGRSRPEGAEVARPARPAPTLTS